jgi:hypothetical protein
MIVDEFLPIYDVSDAVATFFEADVATTWDAVMVGSGAHVLVNGLLDVTREMAESRLETRHMSGQSMR